MIDRQSPAFIAACEAFNSAPQCPELGAEIALAEGIAAYENALWRSVDTDPPPPNQEVLTKMKHGFISGRYDPEDHTFGKYYWRDMDWFATLWRPLPTPPEDV